MTSLVARSSRVERFNTIYTDNLFTTALNVQSGEAPGTFAVLPSQLGLPAYGLLNPGVGHSGIQGTQVLIDNPLITTLFVSQSVALFPATEEGQSGLYPAQNLAATDIMYTPEWSGLPIPSGGVAKSLRIRFVQETNPLEANSIMLAGRPIPNEVPIAVRQTFAPIISRAQVPVENPAVVYTRMIYPLRSWQTNDVFEIEYVSPGRLSAVQAAAFPQGAWVIPLGHHRESNYGLYFHSMVINGSQSSIVANFNVAGGRFGYTNGGWAQSSASGTGVGGAPPVVFRGGASNESLYGCTACVVGGQAIVGALKIQAGPGIANITATVLELYFFFGPSVVGTLGSAQGHVWGRGIVRRQAPAQNGGIASAVGVLTECTDASPGGFAAPYKAPMPIRPYWSSNSQTNAAGSGLMVTWGGTVVSNSNRTHIGTYVAPLVSMI
jgi:hypothetical protein